MPERLRTRPVGSSVSHPLRCTHCAGWSYHWGACPSCPLAQHTWHLTLWRWCSSATSSATWHGSHTQRHCLAGPCTRAELYVIVENQSTQGRNEEEQKEDKENVNMDTIPDIIPCILNNWETNLQLYQWVQVIEEISRQGFDVVVCQRSRNSNKKVKGQGQDR